MRVKDLSPSHTQFPDFLIDHVMRAVGHAEWKIICYVVRRTYGFRQTSATISIAEFLDGKKGRAEGGTGLTSNPIREGLKSLTEAGLLIKTKRGKSFAYEFNMECDLDDFLEAYGKARVPGTTTEEDYAAELMASNKKKRVKKASTTAQGGDSNSEGGEKLRGNTNTKNPSVTQGLRGEKVTPQGVSKSPPLYRHTDRHTETDSIANGRTSSSPSAAPSIMRKNGTPKNHKAQCREWFEWFYENTYGSPYVGNPPKEMKQMQKLFDPLIESGKLSPEALLETFKKKASAMAMGAVPGFEGQLTISALLGFWDRFDESSTRKPWDGRNRRLPKVKRAAR
jgi:hypothetical protein